MPSRLCSIPHTQQSKGGDKQARVRDESTGSQQGTSRRGGDWCTCITERGQPLVPDPDTHPAHPSHTQQAHSGGLLTCSNEIQQLLAVALLVLIQQQLQRLVARDDQVLDQALLVLVDVAGLLQVRRRSDGTGVSGQRQCWGRGAVERAQASTQQAVEQGGIAYLNLPLILPARVRLAADIS